MITVVLKIIYKFVHIFIILLTVIEVTENLQNCCYKFSTIWGNSSDFSS